MITLDSFKNLPDTQEVYKSYIGANSYSHSKYEQGISECDMLMKKAGVANIKAKQNNEKSDAFDDFLKYRAKKAGLCSARKRFAHFQYKLNFIDCLCQENGFEIEQLTFTMLQFIGKKLDGRAFDNNFISDLKTAYREDNVKYSKVITEEQEAYWKSASLLFSLSRKQIAKQKSLNKV